MNILKQDIREASLHELKSKRQSQVKLMQDFIPLLLGNKGTWKTYLD